MLFYEYQDAVIINSKNLVNKKQKIKILINNKVGEIEEISIYISSFVWDTEKK